MMRSESNGTQGERETKKESGYKKESKPEEKDKHGPGISILRCGREPSSHKWDEPP